MKTLAAIIIGLLSIQGALAKCERADIEGDWLLSAPNSDPRCHLSVTASSSRVVCISSIAGTETMTGNVAVTENNSHCVVAGSFLRGDYENFTFLVTKLDQTAAEGYALYGGASFPVSFARP